MASMLIFLASMFHYVVYFEIMEVWKLVNPQFNLHRRRPLLKVIYVSLEYFQKIWKTEGKPAKTRVISQSMFSNSFYIALCTCCSKIIVFYVLLDLEEAGYHYWVRWWIGRLQYMSHWEFKKMKGEITRPKTGFQHFSLKQK